MFNIVSHPEMRIKMIDHRRPIRMAKIKNSGKANVGEKLHFSPIPGWECKLVVPLWKTVQ